MGQRPGCWTPIALPSVIGLLLIVAGKMSDNVPMVSTGAACVFASVVLLGVGLWLRQRGWWE